MTTQNKVLAEQMWNHRAWRMLQETIADDDTTTAEWMKQVHNEASHLLEALHKYSSAPTPRNWMEIDEHAVSLSDLLAGSLR